jgi:signal transduction histidine kinase
METSNDVLNILLVDDDEEDFILTRDILSDIPQRKMKLHWIANYEDALKEIPRNAYDVYLIDYRLGAESGLKLIKESLREGCTKPLILLTGQGDLEIDQQAMKAGAADYMVKGNFNPFHLERSIRYSIEHTKNLNQIRSLNADLEKRVEQRTQDLAQALNKLEQTNQDLKRAEAEILKALDKERELNVMKTKFVTTASHEFRTPLSTILSSASLIARYNNPDDIDKRYKHIDRIKSAVHNLTSILNDFLSIGQLEEGKTAYNPVWLDVVQLSEEITEEMSTVTKEKQHILYQHTGPKKELLVDKQVLKNILINLLSNAIKYSGPGQDIEFATICTEKDYIFSITDNGIGIPDVDKPHLFSQFYRAHNVTNIQGTGLGLIIVKKYVELAQGTIEFTSQEHKGSTFTVKIPMNQ